MKTEVLATFELEGEEDLVAVLTSGSLGFGVGFFAVEAEESMLTTRFFKTLDAATAYAESVLLPTGTLACRF